MTEERDIYIIGTKTALNNSCCEPMEHALDQGALDINHDSSPTTLAIRDLDKDPHSINYCPFCGKEIKLA